MKRPRPTPTFFADSDSDDAAPPAAPRFRPPPATDTSPPLSSNAVSPSPPHADAQPDSLDLFMSTLHPGAPHPQSHAAAPIRPPSPQTPPPPPPPPPPFSPPSVPPLSPPSPGTAAAAAAAAREPAPPDFTVNPPPPVTPAPPTDWPFADPSALAAAGIALRPADDPPGFLHTFEDAHPALPDALLAALPAAMRAPTPVQATAVPALCAGRDVLAVAPTGSGKTLAYGLPLLAHALRQPPCPRSARGPAAVVLAPTRELAEQIGTVLAGLCRAGRADVAVVVGGEDKLRQVRRLRLPTVHTVVATPGRMLDVLRMRAVRLVRVSLVVLDEADRMLDLGFGPQVMAIMSHIRPDAQRALFSATMPSFVRRLADDLLDKPLHLSVSNGRASTATLTKRDSRTSDPGHCDTPPHASPEEMSPKLPKAQGSRANSSPPPPTVASGVSETYLAFDTEKERHMWLRESLSSLVRRGQVIVFCSTRGDAARLANAVRTVGIPAACVHGETAHDDRMGLLKLFRAAELPVLVTTDVSARGLDIENVAVVVNYACAKSWEWHVHRVGRTGRADRSGMAYTLMSRASRTDSAFAAEAAGVLRKIGRDPPAAVAELAAIERKARDDGRSARGGRGRRGGRGGYGQRDRDFQQGRRRGGK